MRLQSLVRLPAIGIGLVALLGVAACGSSSTTTQTTPSSAPPAATSSSPATSGTSVVQTASATVKGSSTTILATTDGKTLYYRTSDTASSVCSAGCAATWPALLLPSGTPSSSSQLAGTLAVSANANGNQVTYNGHPLYNYSKDAVGETKGEGIGGVWHVATPTLT